MAPQPNQYIQQQPPHVQQPHAQHAHGMGGYQQMNNPGHHQRGHHESADPSGQYYNRQGAGSYNAPQQVSRQPQVRRQQPNTAYNQGQTDFRIVGLRLTFYLTSFVRRFPTAWLSESPEWTDWTDAAPQWVGFGLWWNAINLKSKVCRSGKR
jgi:hypothetical protein